MIFSIPISHTGRAIVQWCWNLPQLQRGGRAGGAAWDVLRGPMLLIFIVDGMCALLNAVALLLDI